MPKLSDMIDKDDTEFKSFEQVADEQIKEDEAAAAVPAGPRFAIPEWIKSPTGDGPVEDYIDHVLNFNRSRGLARVIRGFTGILGRNLNLAVVDISLGAMEMSRERKRVVEVAAVVQHSDTAH